MLNATDITVKLGRKTILSGVDFNAAPGDFTCIVGPNGSGKTTLLRALTGDLPYRGQVMLNGAEIGTLNPWQLAELRGVLPQASALAFPFTVEEVVQIGLHRGGSAQQDDITGQALSRVGLGNYAQRYYQELSGGEQQRVQLARVLTQVWQPVSDGQARWLFLDEPVSSLDIAHQLQVMAIARQFADDGGGVIAVMHDLNLTAMYADQITLMAQGQILASGTPGDVMTSEILSNAYGCTLNVGSPPPQGVPFLLPHQATLAAE
jgi:iron complex transport system ATP-binding protein